MNNKREGKTMKPAADRKLEPKLRFPEFRGAGEWKGKHLKNLADVVMGSSPSSEAYNTEGIGLPFMQGNADIKDGLSAPRLFTSQVTKECKVGDILMSVRAPVGTVAKSIHHACIGRGLSSIRALSPNKQEYLYQFLVFFESQWHRISQGGTFDAINSDDLKDLQVTVPRDSAEQQKIADCLSSIDELVTLEAQKLDTLKAHKKGLMQQLFPAEGETLPKLRFPEFRNAGEWKKQKVSSLLKRVSNPVNVNLNEMYRQIGIRSHGKGIFHKELVSGKELGNKRVFWVVEDAFVVNIVFAWEQAVAITTTTEKAMIASHRFPMYKAKANKSDVNYIKYFFLTKKGKHLLLLASPGGAGRNKTLGQKDFENLEFILPEKAKEQQKIASCLSSLDGLITAQTQKLDTLKAHKKGLMQQLFSALDEVQG